LADRLAVSTRTITNLQARRAIPFVRLGRCVRFPAAAVDAAILRLQVPAASTMPARKRRAGRLQPAAGVTA